MGSSVHTKEHSIVAISFFKAHKYSKFSYIFNTLAYFCRRVKMKPIHTACTEY